MEHQRPTDSLRFRLSKLDRLEDHYTLVSVDVAKIDFAWRHPNSNYIGSDGLGASMEKIEFWKRWLQENPGGLMEAPTVHVSERNRVSFYDGRHRFAVLRDGGHRVIKLSVDRNQASRLRRHFGARRSRLAHHKAKMC